MSDKDRTIAALRKELAHLIDPEMLEQARLDYLTYIQQDQMSRTNAGSMRASSND